MTTFNGQPADKAHVLKFAETIGPRVKSDSKTDRQNIFWSSRGWCQPEYVCKEPNCDHRFYADEIGVPVSIAYAEHSLFLELPQDKASTWTMRYLKAIPVGCDLQVAGVFKHLVLYILEDEQHGLINFVNDREQFDAVSGVAKLYRADCEDAEAWKAAADACRKAHFKSPYDNRRMESHEALKHAGCQACYAAEHFARCFEDQRFAAPAIQWSGWVFRYHVYARYVESQQDPRKKTRVDDRGMVNVGESLWNFGEWMRQADEGDRLGEVARFAHYERVSEALLRLIKGSQPAVAMTEQLARDLISGKSLLLGGDVSGGNWFTRGLAGLLGNR